LSGEIVKVINKTYCTEGEKPMFIIFKRRFVPLWFWKCNSKYGVALTRRAALRKGLGELVLSVAKFTHNREQPK
jgi:hypothetical protein